MNRTANLTAFGKLGCAARWVAAAVALVASPAAARPLDDVLAAKSLRVIAYLENAPFSWEAAGGSVKAPAETAGRS